MKSHHTKVLVRKISLEEEFIFDMASGNGFVISEPTSFTANMETIETHNGARSPRFGKKNELKFECKCGATNGLRYSGLACPYCGGLVTKRGVNLKMTGWVDLGNWKIISPLYWIILSGLIGHLKLTEIVNKRWVYMKSGNNVDYRVDLDTLKAKGSKYVFTNKYDGSMDEVHTPFAGIGFMGMYDEFYDILDYCKKKNKSNPQKLKLIEELRETRGYVFTSKIPVYTTVLRPQVTTMKTFNFRSIDIYINNLVNTALNLPNQLGRPEMVERSLMRIQEKANLMWDYTFQRINKKKGEIRGKILGGPINYTSRNVCVLRKGLFANEIEVGYPLVSIIYKYKIIYHYAKKFNMSIDKAEEIVSKYEIFNQDIYDILEEMRKKEGLECLVIRNPTNNLGSILKLKIVSIVPSASHFAIGVPSMILGGLSGDFDGDILNIIGLMTPEMKYTFRLADPIDVMITDKDTTKIRSSMNIDDSASMCIYNFSRL